ncbi:hypothetical protein [Salinicola endophyticus]|nr:hypothetical protein [Salinicola endophyticus]
MDAEKGFLLDPVRAEISLNIDELLAQIMDGEEPVVDMTKFRVDCF